MGTTPTGEQIHATEISDRTTGYELKVNADGSINVSGGGGGGGGAIADVYGTATPLTAATTFTGVPTISQLQANSFVLLANPNDMATFLAEILIASAFVGTLSFYGLEPDAATLQLINAHQRGTTVNANSIAINAVAALNQVWMGSAADFKSVYVVCTAFTSGSASVDLGLTAAPYGMAILNTVATQAASGAFVDGSIASIGTTTQTKATDGTITSWSAIQLLKGIFDKLLNTLAVAGTIASGSADSGNPVKVGGVYNSSAPTLTTGQRGDAQVDVNGNIKQTLATLIAGEDITTNRTVVEQRYGYLNIVATGTTVVKSGAGFIQSISINNPSALTGATTATTIKLYDNTAASGTLIGTFSLPTAANIVAALPFSITFFDQFLTGLTVVITLGTSGAWTPDVTVSYR